MPAYTIEYEEGIAAYDLADAAEEHLHSLGLCHAERPLDDAGQPGMLPKLPNLDDCGPRELKHLIGEFAAWFGYAAGRLAAFNKYLIDATAKKEFTWSCLRRNVEGTVADKDDSVLTDPRYVQVNKEFIYMGHMVEDLKKIYARLEQDIRAISRAVSVTEQQLGIEGVAASVERKTSQRRDTLSRFVHQRQKPHDRP